MSPSTEPSLVDVRVPTIGPAPYLYESVASVMTQSLPAWRLVVSEDEPGRRQASDRIAPFLRDPRVAFTDAHAGRNAARHLTRLVRDGTAPYVAVLDNDDRWGPGSWSAESGSSSDIPSARSCSRAAG